MSIRHTAKGHLFIVAATLALVANLLFSGRVLAACENFILGQLFCFSDRVEERADRDIQLEQIKAQAASNQAAGEAQLELLRQQGQITEAQAREMGESLRKSIDAQMQANLSQYEMASQALANQTALSLVSINESARTARLGLILDVAAKGLILLVLAVLSLAALRLLANIQGQPRRVLPPPSTWVIDQVPSTGVGQPTAHPDTELAINLLSTTALNRRDVLALLRDRE